MQLLTCSYKFNTTEVSRVIFILLMVYIVLFFYFNNCMYAQKLNFIFKENMDTIIEYLIVKVYIILTMTGRFKLYDFKQDCPSSRIWSRGHLGTLTLGPEGPEEVSWLLCTPVKLYSLGWGHLGTSTLGSFTKPPLLQESRFTGGGSPNLADL